MAQAGGSSNDRLGSGSDVPRLFDATPMQITGIVKVAASAGGGLALATDGKVRITWVGLDVHQEEIVVAVLQASGREVIEFRESRSGEASRRKLDVRLSW